jgi:hypothetical protein
MSTPQNPTPEAPEAGECPEGQISRSGLSAPQTADGNAAVEAAVTAGAHDADVSDGAEPDRPAAQQAAPSHPPGNRRANAASTAQVDAMPRWLRRQIEQDLPRIAEAYVPLPNAHFVPSILRRPENADLLRQAGMVVTPPVTPPTTEHQDQPSGFVPRELRMAGLVTLPVTQSQTPAASVTAGVTTPIAGSICPTCHCRVPARMSDAERQRARRARQREQSKPVP